MTSSALDGLTLDQIRMFVSIANEGSFSAAARRLRRVQSAVSHAMNNFEELLGVSVWDRTTRIPRLTAEGEALLICARRVLAEVAQLRRTASGFIGGLEASVGLCVDHLFPAATLVEVCRGFAEAFPGVALTVHTETLNSVAERVIDGSAQLGVIGPATTSDALVSNHVTNVRMVPCVAKTHPLARVRGCLTTLALSEHIQIVLSERSEKGGADQAVLSPKTWRVADIKTKHELILSGLGWGNLPLHMLEGDLARRRLVRLRPEAWDARGFILPLSLVSMAGRNHGPATRWLGEAITAACRRQPGPRTTRSRFRPRRGSSAKK